MSDLKNINIKHIKLVNGEEIVSLVHQTLDDDLVLEFPLLLNAIYNNDNTYTYYFSQYMNLTDDSLIHVNTRAIIAYSNVTDDIKEKYIRSSLRYKENQMMEEQRVNREISEKIRKNVHEMDLDNISTLDDSDIIFH